MPVTSVARTLLDLAATVRADRLERALAQAEARFLWLARDAGLPEPLTNFSLVALDQPASEVDFYWPTYRLVVEIDGWETHGTRAAFEADQRRDAALHAAGERVLRFTWRAIVGDGATVVDRLRAAAR